MHNTESRKSFSYHVVKIPEMKHKGTQEGTATSLGRKHCLYIYFITGCLISDFL
jgi:hypothetical protein